jgi:hypothetical protein
MEPSKSFVKFEFGDDFGDYTKFESNISCEHMTQFDAVVEQFKYFMMAAGFSPELVKEIYPEM